MPTEPWIYVDDVARHFAVSHDTIYRWIEAKGGGYPEARSIMELQAV